MAKWKERGVNDFTDRSAKAFYVPASDIKNNNYDLSISKYKEASKNTIIYEAPSVILKQLHHIELEILSDIEMLKGMI